MNDYEGKYRKVKYFYSGSGELNNAAKLLRWPYQDSLTGIKPTNGLAENAVKPRDHWQKVVDILKQLDKGGRLTATDRKWLPVAEENLSKAR